MESRRDFLHNCGILVAGSMMTGLDTQASPVSSPFAAPVAQSSPYEPLTGVKIPIRGLEAQIDRPITYVVVGAGGRGNAYAAYAASFPQKARIVGVSDINDFRLKNMSDAHQVPDEHRFGDYREILNVPRFADAMVISLPDHLHYDACMKALELGYHVLLEKPMAQTEKECRSLLAQSKKYKRVVALGHVLRYAPYFIALRETARSGIIGDILSIQHLEPIEVTHFTHSYIRGNWHNSKETTPIILSKSCHDLDILRWIIGKPCKSASADGELSFFCEKHVPQGAPMRCTDNCPHEGSCPFSAIETYERKRIWLAHLDLTPSSPKQEVIDKLKNSNYGKCVFHCDNDQPDHYISNFVFESGITATFSMEACTPYGGRRTRIMGTKGFIEGAENEFVVTDFLTRTPKVWNLEVQKAQNLLSSGHGGGDLALFRDFAEAVFYEDPSRLTSNIEASVESHIMAFASEKSRKTMKKVAVKL